MNIKTKAVILREKTIGNDRMVWLLTENVGTVNVYLKGGAGIRSKFTSSTQLFSYGEATLFLNKGYYSLNSFSLITSFFGLQKELKMLSLCSYFAQVALETAPENEEAAEYVSLLLNSFYLVENNKKSIDFIKAVFEMRIMTLSGFMPDLLLCSRCNNNLSGDTFFSISQGTGICHNCHSKNEGGLLIPSSCLYALRHICLNDQKKIFAFDIPPKSLKTLCRLTEQYLLFQLGRGFKTLDFLKSL